MCICTSVRTDVPYRRLTYHFIVKSCLVSGQNSNYRNCTKFGCLGVSMFAIGYQIKRTNTCAQTHVHKHVHMYTNTCTCTQTRAHQPRKNLPSTSTPPKYIFVVVENASNYFYATKPQ
eukprot:GHVS01073498.1.p1 GENE.GHVS01073498.1~~GHVS01073498.1.p1  ORF type:complete len:118 (-),score=6.57 GHVS01073498.1:123-476(-)